jgi:hypothetical protein
MANNLNIVEVTLAQASEATHAVNAIDPTGIVAGTPRKSAYQPVVIRITDHDDNTALEEDDPDLMALFVSSRHGEPWKKDANVLVHKVVQADADPVTNPTDSDVSVLYPNFDYSTFE